MPQENEKLEVCIDRVLTPKQEAEARVLAQHDDADTAPHRPLKALVEKWKLWQPGTRLRVGFFKGDATVKDKVFAKAKEWEAIVSLRFERVTDMATAHIRISFDMTDGSWSFVGRDCLGIPKSQATMNFGWLHADSSDAEYSRTVLHEFGHAIGLGHEHQNPVAGVKWNEAEVYKYFMGPPNNWSKAQVKSNILDKYATNQVNATAFDRESIMLYSIPKRLLAEGEAFPHNSQLSQKDKDFMRKVYPPTA